MTRPSVATIGETAGSRFGVVVVDAAETVDGVARVRCSVVGRGLVVAFGADDWEQGTRPVVDRVAAEEAWTSLVTVDPPTGEREVTGVLQRSHEISLGMDFTAKVEALRELQVLDDGLHPAREVLAFELQQAIGSELGHVLGREVDAVVAELRSRLDRTSG